MERKSLLVHLSLTAKRQNQRHNLRTVIEKRKNTFKRATVKTGNHFPDGNNGDKKKMESHLNC